MASHERNLHNKRLSRGTECGFCCEPYEFRERLMSLSHLGTLLRSQQQPYYTQTTGNYPTLDHSIIYIMQPEREALVQKSGASSALMTQSRSEGNEDQRPRVQSAQGPQQTRPRTPSVTSNPRLSLFQQTLISNVSGGATSPDGGINLRSCEPPTVSTSTGFPRLSTVQPTSPAVTANTCVRRSEYGSFLLQSPARAGHATQMRRIFEDANHTFHGAHQPRGNLYPQLPNISRKASSPPVSDLASQGRRVCRSPKYCPESLCLSTRLLSPASQRGVLQASHGNESEASAGSWSNDSGYIVTESRDRRSGSTVPSKERILDWIYGISAGQADSSPYGEDFQTAGPQLDLNCREPHEETSVELIQRVEKEEQDAPMVWPHCEHVRLWVPQGLSTIDDPFLSHKGENTITAPRLGSGTHLPKSPWHDHRAASHFSDTCEILKFDSDKENNQPLLEATTEGILLLQHNPRNTPTHEELLEEGGVQFSPLSPNVCTERGPSRYHTPRKPRNAENTLTPSKRSYNTPFPAGRLKENVVTGKEATPHFCSPLTPRSSLLGTRFRRSQQSRQPFGED